ncbi:hypothetical protein NCCP28_23640 [Niallia sp. NCCP-28]|nr:hypothetical protein NCCP28_23640 [Niallia sp. NCCP-28]
MITAASIHIVLPVSYRFEQQKEGPDNIARQSCRKNAHLIGKNQTEIGLVECFAFLS